MKKIKITDVADESVVVEQVHEYASLKFSEKNIISKRKEIGDQLLPLMSSHNITKKKVKVNDDYDGTVSIRTRSHSNINPEKLKKALGAKEFNKLTTRTLDESKLEDAIHAGDIDPRIVASCMEHSDTDYLDTRFTKRKRKKEE